MKRSRGFQRFFCASLTIFTFVFPWLGGGAASAAADRAGSGGGDGLPPAHSVYSLATTLPHKAAVGEPVAYTVTLQTVEPGPATYGNVHYEIDAAGPGNASFTGVGPDGERIAFVNRWNGDTQSFPLPPRYSGTTQWSVTFSNAGMYTVSYRVVARNGDIVAQNTTRVEALPPHSAYRIDAQFPQQVGAGQYFSLPVTVSTYRLGMSGYDRTTVQIAKTSGDGNVILTAEDADHLVKTSVNQAEWGAPGFALPAQYSGTTDWTVKFTKAGAYRLEFRLMGEGGEVLAETVREVTAEPSFTNLGMQVYNNTIMRGAFGREDGKDVAYTVLVGDPAKLVVADVQTEQILKVRDLPGATGAWGVTVATDGKVYLGSYGTASLYEYDPVKDTVTNLGDPVAGTPGAEPTTQFFELSPGPDGKIFGGVYPTGAAFEYDPAAGFTNFGTMVAGQSYLRCVAYDAGENVLYAGGGGTKAFLIKYDLNTGAKTDILPAQYKFTFTYDLNLVGDKLFLKMDPGYNMIVLDKHTGQVLSDSQLIHSRGVSPKSPYANVVYFTYGGILKSYDLDTNEVKDVYAGSEKIDFKANIIGWGLVQLDDPDYPGYTLAGFAGNSGGQFMKYNLSKGTLKQLGLPLPNQPISLYTLGEGPDGKIYAGGFLPGGMGIFDPRTGESTNNQIGQTEGMASLGSKMYFGVYPDAKIYEYDTTKPWKSSGSGRTVNQLFELKSGYEQDRPVAMLGAENKLFIGTVPDYGKLGGALTVYDPARTPVTYQVYRNIVPNQSIVSLAYWNGNIFGGSSIRGGLGSEPTEKEAKLFVWDIAAGQKVFETVPVPGKAAITALIAGPDGNIWGMAMGTLFIVDPETKKIVYSEEKFPEAQGTWHDARLAVGADGLVYGTIADKFFRIDPATKDVTVLRDHASQLAQDDYGNVYFKDGNDLWRYTREDDTIAVTGVRLEPAQLELAVGQTANLTAAVEPSMATRKGVVWSSDNSAVATVNSGGTVKAVSPGTARITVTTLDGGKTATAVVTVK